MTSFLYHGRNEVLDVPWRYVMTGWGSPHNSMASCTGRRRPLHLQKTHAHRPKCHLTIDQALEKDTHGGMTQIVRESAAAADLNPCALNWKEWRRWLDVTPWHVPPIFAVACVMDNLFFFIVRCPRIHIAPYIRLQTFLERSRKSPFLKRSASKAFQRILTTPPSDFADASVIVKLPPNWVKLPSST